MKHQYGVIGLFCILSVISLRMQAQILNPGFENWTGGNPDSWHANNVPGAYTTVTSTTTAHSGSSALRGDAISFFTTVASPLIQSGVDGKGFPFTGRPASFTCYYQFSPAASSGDRFAASATLMKGGVVGGTVIAGGTVALGTAVSSYTQFTVHLEYASQDVPDVCVIQVQIIGPGDGEDALPHAGSYYLLDDLAFSGTTGVSSSGVSPDEFRLDQNYPNPFNPSTTIGFTIPVSGFTTLKIYDELGREVSTLVNEVKDAGSYRVKFDAANVAGGVYFYRLASGNVVQMKKMLLLK